MQTKIKSKAEKFILLGVPVLFIAGSLLHFLYSFTGSNPVAGLISPVNESVWEHLKLALIPVILWWYAGALLFRGEINLRKWMEGALTALIVSLLTVPFLFYFYTQAFGIESLIIDIVIFFLAVLFGQLAGLHLFRNGKGIPVTAAILFFVFLLLIFFIFTCFPPQLPIFMEP